ncbi:MAG: dienelactone hydrolase family protein [Myxococcota bacterium]
MGRGAGAFVATWLSGCGPAPADHPASPPSTPPHATGAGDATPTVETKQRAVTVQTPDGTADAFFVSPTTGRHPGVIVWPDIAGLREAFETMAARLAARGYAVLVVNQYYRSAKAPVLRTFSEWQTDEGRAKIDPMRAPLTAAAIASDGAAFVAWLDQQAEVDPDRKLATSGYCMGGPFTFRTAAAAPERVGAIASFHGGGLATEADDSPHLLLPRMRAAALVCVAQSDDERNPAVKSTLREAFAAAGLTAELEVYPARHGWCVTDSPVYDGAQADRAWSRMLATFEAHLSSPTG